MEAKMRLYSRCVLFVLIAVIAIPLVALAQKDNPGQTYTLPYQGEVASGALESGPMADWSSWTWFEMDLPHEVFRFLVYSADATKLKLSVMDADAPGDRWRATVKIWDKSPQTRTVTGNGSSTTLSSPVTVNNYGKTPLRAYIEVRYHYGNNVFPCSGWFKVETDGIAGHTVTSLGKSDF